MVEHRLPKPRVAGPNPVSRSGRTPCISRGFPEIRRVRRSVHYSALAPLMHQTVSFLGAVSGEAWLGPPRQPGEFANVCYQRLRPAIFFASSGPPGQVGRGWWVQIPPRPCPQPADSARSAGLLRRSWKARCRDLHHHCTKRSSSSCPKRRFGQSRVLQFLRPQRPRLGMRAFRTTTQVHRRQRRFPPSRGRE